MGDGQQMRVRRWKLDAEKIRCDDSPMHQEIRDYKLVTFGGIRMVSDGDLSSRLSLKVRDLRTFLDVSGNQTLEHHDLNDAMIQFEEFCRSRKQKFASVETLDLVELDREPNGWSKKCPRLLDSGFMRLIELFEDGYFNGIRNLRICVQSCRVSPSSMKRFFNVFRGGHARGHVKDLESFYIHFTHTTQAKTLFSEAEAKAEDVRAFENILNGEGGCDEGACDEGACDGRAHEFLMKVFWDNFPELLLSSPHLEELTISDDGLSDDETSRSGMRAVEVLADQSVSGHLASLRVLNLSGLGLRSDSVKSLVQSFHASGLKTLKLECNQLGMEGAKHIAEMLSGRLGSLETLDLSNNKLGNNGMVSFLASLLECGQSMLENLGLACNEIGDMGIRCLAEALEEGKFPMIRGLDIHGNRFGNEGLMALAKAFRSASSLCCLATVSLYWSPISLENTAAGLIEIAGALGDGHLPSLVKMELVQDQCLPATIKDALENSYFRNPNLIVNYICHGRDTVNADRYGRQKWSIWLETLRRSNEERLERLRVLGDEEDVSGKHGKIFLCGDPLVGKTTLRLTLCDEGDPTAEGPERTRGIEVSTTERKGVTLALWDLAGQHDFEVLHSAFLPDLNFANGQATFFVIVCDVRSFEKAKVQLEYWMRFISSNSVKDMELERRRCVFVVLNCFNGCRVPDGQLPRWTRFLATCGDAKKGFGRYLDLFKEPFILNATDREEVEALKGKLFNEAVGVLGRRKMPKVCQMVQEVGNIWAQHPENSKYPVLRWDDYRRVVVAKNLVQNHKLEAAAEYLHEAGHVILFKKLPLWEGQTSTSEGGLVIVNPEWFCKQLVGNLLLPPHMSNMIEDLLDFQREEAGAIGISTLTKEEFDVPAGKVDEVIMILSRLGICYQLPDRAGSMFIPALVEEVDMPGWSAESWDRCITGWVMGYSLKVENMRATLLPVNVLRKLQVSIAVDECIGRRPDSDYVARKHSVCFKFKSMHVFIEYSALTQERMDILVKPLVEDLSKREQINVAQEFASRIRAIVKECACGVELEKRVIQPWSVAQGWKDMRDRNIDVPVDFVLEDVRKKRTLGMTNWGVEGKPVWEEDILSAEELSRCFSTEELRFGAANSSHKKIRCISSRSEGRGDDLRLLERTILEVKEGQDRISMGQDRINAGQDRISAGQDRISLGQDKIIAGQDRMDGRQDRFSAEIMDWRYSLSLQIHSLERLFMEDRELDVPRFAYVTDNGWGPRRWFIHLNRVVARPVVLRLLCEAPWDGQAFHEVMAQEGIDLNMIKDWARKLLPAVIWTMRVTSVAAKTLPGLMLLLSEDSELSKIFGNMADLTPGKLSDYLSDDFAALVSSEPPHPSSSGVTTSSWRRGTETKMGGNAIKALRKVRKELETNGEWNRKVGLTRVRLRQTNGEKHVVWICKECHDHYTSHTPGNIENLSVL